MARNALTWSGRFHDYEKQRLLQNQQAIQKGCRNVTSFQFEDKELLGRVRRYVYVWQNVHCIISY